MTQPRVPCDGEPQVRITPIRLAFAHVCGRLSWLMWEGLAQERSTLPRQMVPGCRKKRAEHEPGSKWEGAWVWEQHPSWLLLPALPWLPQWWGNLGLYDEINPFLPQLGFGHSVYFLTVIEKKTRTQNQKRQGWTLGVNQETAGSGVYTKGVVWGKDSKILHSPRSIISCPYYPINLVWDPWQLPGQTGMEPQP